MNEEDAVKLLKKLNDHLWDIKLGEKAVIETGSELHNEIQLLLEELGQ